jgi:uncharacterized protein YqfA (UPF0365 family)
MNPLYIVLPILVLLAAGLMMYIYVPIQLQNRAHNANLNTFSLTYGILKFQKINAEFILDQFVKARQVGVPLNFKELKEYHLSNPDKTENMVNVLIRAKRSGVKTDITQLEKFENSGGNPGQLVAAQKDIKNANIDVSREILETHSLYGGDIKIFVEILIRAKKANLELDLRKLVEENLSDEDMRKIVNTLIRIKKAGLYVTPDQLKKESNKTHLQDSEKFDLRISQQSLLEHFRAGIEIERYAAAMITAKKTGIEIDKDALNIHYLTDGDVEKLISSMIKAERAGLQLTQKEISEHNIEGRDIGKIIKNLIKARQAGLDLSIEEMVEYYRLSGDSDDLVIALIKDKEEHLGIGKKELEDHFLAGADILGYVKAREILKNNPDFGITTEELNSHYIKGGNVLKCLFAIMYARQNDIPINASLALKIDLLPQHDLDEVVKWAVNPAILEVAPSATIISKDGIQITPKLRVTVRGKFNNYLKGSREEILFGRINEALTHEISSYANHKEVLNNLKTISDNIIKRLLGKMKYPGSFDIHKFELEDEIQQSNEKEIHLNKSSAYEILDVKIYDLEVGKDTLAQYKTEHAEHEKHLASIHYHERASKAKAEEAEARVALLKAKAKLQSDMAEGIKTGNFKYSDYQKDKLLFEDSSKRRPHTEHHDSDEDH